MPSPSFQINGGGSLIKVAVEPGGAVVAELDNIDDVAPVTWEIERTDDLSEVSDYSFAQSGSVGQTYTGTALEERGTFAVIAVTVSGGYDPSAGAQSVAMTARCKFYVPTEDGLEPLDLTELEEDDNRLGDPVHGAAKAINQAIRRIGGTIVRAACTGALPANTRTGNTMTADANGALPAQDGVTLSAGDRFLVPAEGGGASHINNGVWALDDAGSAGTKWSATRLSSWDESAEVCWGLLVHVREGTTNAGRTFKLVTANEITVNTTALEFVYTSGPDFGSADIVTTGQVDLGSDPAVGTGGLNLSNDTSVAFMNAAGTAFAGLVYSSADYLTLFDSSLTGRIHVTSAGDVQLSPANRVRCDAPVQFGPDAGSGGPGAAAADGDLRHDGNAKVLMAARGGGDGGDRPIVERTADDALTVGNSYKWSVMRIRGVGVYIYTGSGLAQNWLASSSSMSVQLCLAEFATGSLPGGSSSGMVGSTDDGGAPGGSCPLYYDGSTWRRVSDNAEAATDGPKTYSVRDSLQIAGGAAATAVLTIADADIANGEVVHVRAVATARDVTSGDSASYERIATFEKTAGTITQVGSTSAPHTAEEDASWNCDLQVLSGDIVVRCTPDGTNATNWDVHADVWIGS